MLSLQPSLLMSLRDDNLRCLYQGVSTVVSLCPSLPMPLQGNILRHLCRGVSKVVSLRSSIFASLRSEFLQSSLLKSLWNIFLRRLYGGISMVISIPSKPVIFLQHLCGCISTIFSIQAKPETSTF